MGTIRIKNVDTEILTELSNLNVGEDGHRKCDGITRINCTGINCTECPLDNEMYALKDVRDELAKRQQEQSDTTESHKGGGAGIHVTGEAESGGFIPTSSPDVDTSVCHPKHYGVSNMKNIQYNVLSALVERNHHKPDDFNPKGKTHACTARFHCTNVDCAACPFSNMNDPHKVITMGDLREELQKRRREITESHKGGGAGTYTVGKSEPMEFIPARSTDVDTAVYHPKHYEVIDEVEAIQVIARSMTVEQFKGYCLGNILKYRLRLGSKDAVEQDLKKAQNYKDIFEKHKGLCHDAAK